MKLINFFNAQDHLHMKQFLVELWTIGDPYEQVAKDLAKHDYYMPEDQWLAFKILLDTQVAMDIGERRNEVSK